MISALLAEARKQMGDQHAPKSLRQTQSIDDAEFSGGATLVWQFGGRSSVRATLFTSITGRAHGLGRRPRNPVMGSRRWLSMIFCLAHSVARRSDAALTRTYPRVSSPSSCLQASSQGRCSFCYSVPFLRDGSGSRHGTEGRRAEVFVRQIPQTRAT